MTFYKFLCTCKAVLAIAMQGLFKSNNIYMMRTGMILVLLTNSECNLQREQVQKGIFLTRKSFSKTKLFHRKYVISAKMWLSVRTKNQIEYDPIFTSSNESFDITFKRWFILFLMKIIFSSLSAKWKQCHMLLLCYIMAWK